MTKILAPFPHFFKVVVFPDDLCLRLPDAFTRKYRHELQKLVFLKVPNGVSWQVELVHYENGCSLLQKGWKEFAEFYSIEIYHFLVFRYEGDSLFHVLIFDPTASEIDYPSSSSSNSGENRSANLCVEPDINLEVEQEEIVEVEVLHHQTAQTCKGKRKQMVETRRTCPRTRRGKKPTNVNQSKGVKSDVSFTKQAKAKIYRVKFKLHEAKSSRPFFISFMQHYNVLPSSSRLEIPWNFVKKHLSIKENCKFLLRVSRDGVTRNWPVLVTVEKYSGRVRFCRGLDKFVKENDIKVNDVCVFEFVRGQGSGGRAFDVTVYPSCGA